jgi:hypothetical protein
MEEYGRRESSEIKGRKVSIEGGVILRVSPNYSSDTLE